MSKSIVTRIVGWEKFHDEVEKRKAKIQQLLERLGQNKQDTQARDLYKHQCEELVLLHRALVLELKSNQEDIYPAICSIMWLGRELNRYATEHGLDHVDTEILELPEEDDRRARALAEKIGLVSELEVPGGAGTQADTRDAGFGAVSLYKQLLIETSRRQLPRYLRQNQGAMAARQVLAYGRRSERRLEVAVKTDGGPEVTFETIG